MKNFLSEQKLLVIAPHADDETLGCGGFIYKIKDAGGKVYVMVMSVGDLKHYIHNLKETKKDIRCQELKKALKFLKVDDYEIIYQDNNHYMRLDSIPQRELIETIEARAKLSISKIKPTIVALPFISSNQDHQAVFKAGFAACRPSIKEKKFFPDMVLVYEQPHVSWSWEGFKPNFYVDISLYLSKKLKAFSSHKSQVSPSPHLSSLENVERMARLRGAEIGVEAAEAYICLRSIF